MIGLILNTFSLRSGAGIARYCQELTAGLSRNQNVQIISSTPPHFRFSSIINHLFLLPYNTLTQANKLDLIHATDPSCMFSFPFLNRPKVVTYNDLISLLCKDSSNAFHTRLLSPFILRIGKLADHIIAISSQTKNEIITHLGIPSDKITVVNMGVERKFKPLRKEPRDVLTIGYVGALRRRKRLDLLLKTFRLLKDKPLKTPVRLVICGNKSYEFSTLVKMASDLEIIHDVEFRGFVPEDELVNTYNSFDVFVMPSEWEGFGIPILEAQRCGVPVIIRETAHIPSEVSRACLKARSENDMANKIYNLIEDEKLKSTIIANGIEHSRKFSWDNMVEKTLEVYRKVLQC